MIVAEPAVRTRWGIQPESQAQRRLGEWLLLIMAVLLAVTLLQRFAVPGSNGLLGLGFVVCLIACGLGVLRGQLVIDPVRLLLYLFAIGTLIVTLFFQQGRFSLFSLAMLALLYLPFVTMREHNLSTYGFVLEIFQRVMILSGLIGLVQFMIQLPLGPDWMFPFDRFLPASLFIDGFNLRIPITDTLPYLKSTGLWFLEPSHFSQLLALAILIEISYQRRLAVLMLFAVSYLASFSGTGALLMLAMGLPLIMRIRQPWLLLPVVAFFLVLPFFQTLPPFSIFLSRLDELNNPMASGSMRFLAPYWLVGDVLLNDPRALLFGFGPGSIEDVIRPIDYMVQDSSWLKLLIEYGLVGTGGFFGFYLYVLFRHAPDRLLAFACLLQFLFLGGYLNAFYIQFLHMVLVGWPRLAPETASHEDLGRG